MGLKISEVYTETPENQENCVFCGKPLGDDYVWALAITRKFKVCNEECEEGLKKYIQEDKKYKTPMFFILFVICIVYMLSLIFKFNNLLIFSVCLLLGGVAFFFMPYPIVSFETFYRVSIKGVKKVCKVIGLIFLLGGLICGISFFCN